MTDKVAIWLSIAALALSCLTIGFRLGRVVERQINCGVTAERDENGGVRVTVPAGKVRVEKE